MRKSLKRTDKNSLLSFAKEQVFLKTHQLSVFPLQGGIDFRPGVRITPFTLLYGCVGTSLTSVKLQIQADYWGNLSTTWNLTDQCSKQNTFATLRLGGGIEQVIFSDLHLRLDYRFTDYGTLKLTGAASGSDSSGFPVSLNYSTAYHLIDHSVLLGLSFYFW